MPDVFVFLFLFLFHFILAIKGVPSFLAQSQSHFVINFDPNNAALTTAARAYEPTALTFAKLKFNCNFLWTKAWKPTKKYVLICENYRHFISLQASAISGDLPIYCATIYMYCVVKPVIRVVVLMKRGGSFMSRV